MSLVGLALSSLLVLSYLLSTSKLLVLYLHDVCTYTGLEKRLECDEGMC